MSLSLRHHRPAGSEHLSKRDANDRKPNKMALFRRFFVVEVAAASVLWSAHTARNEDSRRAGYTAHARSAQPRFSELVTVSVVVSCFVVFRVSVILNSLQHSSFSIQHCFMSQILVVEDDADIAALIAHYLEKAGHRVDRLTSGTDVLPRLRKIAGRSGHPRSDAAGHGWPDRRARRCAPIRRIAEHPDHHADGARRGIRSRVGARARRRRLRHQAVQPERAERARDGAAAARRPHRHRRAAPLRADHDRRRPPSPSRSTARTCG